MCVYHQAHDLFVSALDIIKNVHWLHDFIQAAFYCHPLTISGVDFWIEFEYLIKNQVGVQIAKCKVKTMEFNFKSIWGQLLMVTYSIII